MRKVRVALCSVVLTGVVAACAEKPAVMMPVRPEKYASKADMQRDHMVADARCRAIAMNAMGPPAISRQPPAQITNVAQAAVIVNNPSPRQNGVWDFGAVNRPSPQINYQPPADDIDWNAFRENQVRHQRAEANFFGCMAEAGFLRAPNQ